MQISIQHLNVLCDVALAAGLAVMQVYQSDFASWEKADASPLTQADLQADKVIGDGLQAAFPGSTIWSEESVAGDKDPSAGFFLVDPLDGTREFLKRNGEFTVNIAWIAGGEPVMGVVYAPALGELFYAAKGLGAWKHDSSGTTRSISCRKFDGKSGPLRIIGSRSHGGAALATWMAGLRCEHEFVAVGSSLKFCRIAEGQADIYPRFGPTSQWDTAAGQCVLVQAGGRVANLAGEPLPYGLDRPQLNSGFVAVGDDKLLVLCGMPPPG